MEELIVHLPLDGVSQGMSEVQNLALAEILLILRDHIALQAHALRNHALPLPLGILGQQKFQEFLTPYHAVLDDFRHALFKHFFRQGVQRRDVAEHQMGLREGAH